MAHIKTTEVRPGLYDLNLLSAREQDYDIGHLRLSAHYAGLGKGLPEAETKETAHIRALKQNPELLFLEATGNETLLLRYFRAKELYHNSFLKEGQSLYVAARGAKLSDSEETLQKLLADYPYTPGSAEELTILNYGPSAMAFFLKHQA